MSNKLPAELFDEKNNCQISSFLKELEICKVSVSQALNAWEIYFYSKIQYNHSTLEEGEKILLQKLPKLDQIKLIPALTCDCLNNESKIKEYMDRIFINQAPVLRNCFQKTTTEYNRDKNEIIIKTGSSWAYNYLKKNNGDMLIKDKLVFSDGETRNVLFVYDSELEEIDPIQTIENFLPEIKAPELTKNTEPKKEKNEFGRKRNTKKVSLKNYKGEVKEISSLREEENNIVVESRVFDIQSRELKTGKILLSISMTDGTSSIVGKYIKKKEEAEEILSNVKTEKFYRFSGNVQHDQFAKEYILMLSNYEELIVEQKTDNYPEKRVELHLHTNMSKTDAMNPVDDYVKKAAFYGHKAIAVTDHGVVQAFPDAYFAGEKHGVKIIYGIEAYVFRKEETKEKKGKKNYHFIILVKNRVGLKNLYHLISESQLKYYKKVPRIPMDLLIEYREGLIFGSACEAGELITSIVEGKDEDELHKISEFYDFLEIQPTGNNEFMIRNGIVKDKKELEKINLKVIELGEKLNIPVIATGDVHFLNPEDSIYRRIIQAGQGYTDAVNQPPLYYRTTEEMLEEFCYLDESKALEVVVKNPNLIADMVEKIRPIPDKLYPPEIEGAEDEIRDMTFSKAKELYGDNLPEIVAKRINKELNSIISNGYAVLYLISQKLVKKSNEDGYLVGSRGSVGSSLVATLTGITEVNPLAPHYRCPSCYFTEFFEKGEYGSGADLPERECPDCGTQLEKDGFDIPFEVFLGFEGDKVPDIDLNFSGEYQASAHKYVEELFGKDHVFRAGTIATVAEKTAFGYVKNYLEENNIYYNSAELSRLIKGCTGVKRTTGQHPGGLIVVPKSKEASDFTPLQRPAEDVKSGTVTTHFDFHSLHDYLVKLDILGHDDPTVIKMLEDLTGLDARKIKLDNPEVMSLFSSTKALGVSEAELLSKVGTYGIPEFGTKFVRQMLEDTKPQNFSDLVRISGFSHGTDVWLNNAQYLIKSKTCHLSEAISARDDIMTYLINMNLDPLVSFKIMEDVRKGKGLKKDYEDEMRKFNVPEWYIESCNKIKYMFPKAHAVAYVMMAFRIAYFKIFHPLAFYAAFFSVRASEFDAEIIVKGKESVLNEIKKIQEMGNQASQKEIRLLIVLEVALEMYLRGFSFQIVSLDKSTANRFIIEGNQLIPPFGSLPGIGETAALNIEKERDLKEFKSIEDLRIRAKVSKTVIETMLNHGSLEGLPENNQLSFFA